MTQESEVRGGTLHLYNLKIDDSGTYTCRAVNNETSHVFEDRVSITITRELWFSYFLSSKINIKNKFIEKFLL